MVPTPVDVPRTGTALAAAVRAGRVSPEQAVDAALARIAAHDPSLHAFTVVRGTAARAEARALAGLPDLAHLPLAGVPVAVKDSIAVAGEPLRYGSRAVGDLPQPSDDEMVRRLRAAGAVVVGLTTCPEAMLWPTTDDADGVTRNPWDPGLSAGGSSGGAAAAVAAGMVPLAQGDDGLGSIRIPAAVCGVVGLKPGRDVVLPYDPTPEGWYGLAERGPIASTVADAALLLSVLAARPELAAVRGDVAGLRVRVVVNPPVRGVTVDPAVVRLTFDVAATLRQAGAVIRRQPVRYPTAASWAGLVRWFAVAVPALDLATDRTLLQPRTRVQAGIGLAVRQLVRERDAQAWRRRAVALFDSADVLLSPVLATGALPAHAWAARSWAANVRTAIAGNGGLTGVWNLAGLPVITVPAGRHPRTGVPVGVQLVGPPDSEARLLGVAAVLERIRPWPLRAPGCE